MAGRPILALISLVLLAGGIVLQFFIILAGAVNGSPLDLTWFISTNNPGGRIANAPTNIAWTFFAVCGFSDGRTQDCRPPVAALPFSPDRNFGTTQGVPMGFLGNHYYLLSRVMFAFFLMALFFSVAALFGGLLALCSRIGGVLSGAATLIAFVFQAIAAALMTACFIQGRDLLNSNGFNASIGQYAFGFAWASTVCFLICVILFCVSAGRKDGGYGSKSGRFGRQTSTRSRDGVKSDYS